MNQMIIGATIALIFLFIGLIIGGVLVEIEYDNKETEKSVDDEADEFVDQYESCQKERLSRKLKELKEQK